VDWNKALPDL